MSPFAFLIVLASNFLLGYLHLKHGPTAKPLWRSPAMQANAGVLWIYLILQIQANSIEVFGQVPQHLALSMLLVAPFLVWLAIAFTVAGFAFGYKKEEDIGIIPDGVSLPK